MTGLISNIQRFSVHDGYGIRTIVFLSGCTLACKWCQNPETIDGRAALMFNRNNCIGCGQCVGHCPRGALSLDAEKGHLVIDREACDSCFDCVDYCYHDALNPSVREMNLEEVFTEVMKDEVFFRNSGGGLTLSGGEPFCQLEFSVELARRVREKGIHTAMETAANVPYDSIRRILPFIDLVLFDIKAFSPEIHKAWTFVDNRLILDNFARITGEGKEVIVRVPLIPQVNDGEEFRKIVDHVVQFESIGELHILPFHTLGESKYTQLEMHNHMHEHPEDNEEEVEACRAYAESRGLRVSVGGSGF